MLVCVRFRMYQISDKTDNCVNLQQFTVVVFVFYFVAHFYPDKHDVNLYIAQDLPISAYTKSAGKYPNTNHGRHVDPNLVAAFNCIIIVAIRVALPHKVQGWTNPNPIPTYR